MGYKSKQKEKPASPRPIDYSPSLLEKALGFVKVFGLTSVPEGVKSVLEYARKRGDITKEQIEFAQSRYERNYAKNPFEKMFS
jgi:hypothetical protein